MKALYFDNSLARILMLQVASKFYRNAAMTSISPTRYTDVPEPELPNSRWLKVRNIACGLCGSDIHFMFMELDPKTFPAAIPGISRKYLGHELVGEVTELGKEVKNLKIGDRVCLRIDWPSCFQMELDPMCPECRKGEYMLCRNLGMKDLPLVDTGGGFSPYMVMHRTQPFKVPPSLTNDEAVLIEPLACAVHGARKQPPQKGDRVLVIGCGAIGLLTIAAARGMRRDIEIIALARYPFQGEMAKKMGADKVISGRGNPYKEIANLTGAKYHEGFFGNRILLGGFDIVYDTVGNDRSISDAFRWTRSGGAVIILGINFKPGKIDYTPIWNQELRVSGINCHAMEGKKSSFDIAAELLVKKSVPFGDLVTHRFPMPRYRDAIKMFFSKGNAGAVKIVLEHEL